MKVYTSETAASPDPGGRTKVGIADYAVVTGDATLTTSGLGSCVGIALFDSRAAVAGLAHAMLPTADGASEAAKYVDTAVPALLDALVAAGANPRRVRAKLAGGSTMFEFTSADASIGERNADAARSALSAAGVDLVASDVGGDYGRSLELVAASGDLHVRSAHAGRTTI